MRLTREIFQNFFRSPWILWVGVRYLRSKKNSKFLSFISLLSVLGVGVGVMAMIVVLSVMDGFESELKKRLMTSDLHVLISPTPQIAGFENGVVPAPALNEKFFISELSQAKEIESFWPVLSAESILKTGKKVTGVVLKGVPDDRLERIKKQGVEFADASLMTEREGDTFVALPGVWVGQELAYELGVLAGDRITLISPTEMEGPLGNIPRLKRFVVEGIYRSGIPEQELHAVFTSIAHARAYLRKTDGVSQWEVSVRDFAEADGIADEIRQKLGASFRVEDWIQLNAHLFASLRLERIAMFIILAFIIIVASFNIVTTLTLMVLEKKKEIAILRTMGALESEVSAIFFAEGVLIGVLGVGGGTVVGALICLALKRYELITLPEIYYDRTLPVTFAPGYYGLVAWSALCIVLVACLYPSIRAARLRPLDGIRGES